MTYSNSEESVLLQRLAPALATLGMEKRARILH